jgi:hypothetical protein
MRGEGSIESPFLLEEEGDSIVSPWTDQSVKSPSPTPSERVQILRQRASRRDGKRSMTSRQKRKVAAATQSPAPRADTPRPRTPMTQPLVLVENRLIPMEVKHTMGYDHEKDNASNRFFSEVKAMQTAFDVPGQVGVFVEEVREAESSGMAGVGARNRPNWREAFLRGSANESHFEDMRRREDLNRCVREYEMEDERLQWDGEGDHGEDWN